MDTEKTNQELWEEVLRTAETLRKIESGQVEPLEKKMVMGENITKEDIPTDYISDAQILTSLLLELKERSIEIA